jgi:hypothetical protein
MIRRIAHVLGYVYCAQCGWWSRPMCGHTD